MTDIADTLKRLVAPDRGPGRLPDAPSRSALSVAISEAVPEAAQGGGGGVVSPLVEQAYAGATYYSITSSDGLFVFEYGDQTEYLDADGLGESLIVKHIDQDA